MFSRTVSLVVLLALIGTSVGHEPTPKDTAILADVAKAWQGRVDRVKRLKCSWTEKQTYVRGSILGPNVARTPGENVVLPEKTLTRDASYELVIDGKKMRLAGTSPHVSTTSTLVDQKITCVFDGSCAKRYLPPGAVDYPLGYIMAQVPRGDICDMAYLPLLMTLSSSHSSCGHVAAHDLKDGRFIVEQPVAPLDGRPCVLLKETKSPDARPERAFWVDPERDGVVMRLTCSRDGKLIYQIDMRSFSRQNDLWIPKEWQTVTFNQFDGSVERSIVATLLNASVNERVDPTTFELQFPPGTLVEDLRPNQATAGKVNAYLIKADGKRRDVTDDELPTSYGRLMETESGKAAPSTALPVSLLWLVPINACLVSGIALVLWLRKWRKQENTRRLP